MFGLSLTVNKINIILGVLFALILIAGEVFYYFQKDEDQGLEYLIKKILVCILAGIFVCIFTAIS